MLIGNTVKLSAYYREVPLSIEIVVNEGVVDEEGAFPVLMTELGFNDPVERTIVFGFVAILTALLLLWKKVSTFAILLVVGAELSFFMYIGVIPVFATIIIMLVLIFLGMSQMRGGSNE